MEAKLKEIYTFLSENRQYNFELQRKTYLEMTGARTEPADKIIAVLYDIANTQSQPSIDSLSDFFRHIDAHRNELDTFKGFLQVIQKERGQELQYNSIFNNLILWPGWGDKTAALLSKTVYHFHKGEYSGIPKIWNDIPSNIETQDNLHLPVDAVIFSIFNKISTSMGQVPKPKWSFHNINKKLQTTYKGDQFEIWDDLWFWGFITQHGSDEPRDHRWNPNKYWMLKDADKNTNTIEAIEKKAQEFIKIISNP